MVARGCGDLALTECDIFSLRYLPDGTLWQYPKPGDRPEPGVIVEGSAGHLDRVLQVAADMNQDRLVPEITGVETQVYFKPQRT
jgi:hypothetical protein